MFGFIFYEKMGANRKVVYGGVVAKLQLLLWFVSDNKKNIRFAQIKRINVPKSNISKKKLMVKSFIMKNDFEF